MAYLGALFGLAMSIPLGWFGAYNMTPSRRFVYPVARLFTMGFRAVHEMIWAILFVSILGFGMLPGVLALTFFCAGFAGKLFAEEIEAIVQFLHTLTGEYQGQLLTLPGEDEP